MWLYWTAESIQLILISLLVQKELGLILISYIMLLQLLANFLPMKSTKTFVCSPGLNCVFNTNVCIAVKQHKFFYRNLHCIYTFFLLGSKDENKSGIVVCYIEHTSPIKKKGTLRYLNCSLQATSSGVQVAVCFSPERKEAFDTLERQRRPVKLSKYAIINKHGQQTLSFKSIPM